MTLKTIKSKIREPFFAFYLTNQTVFYKRFAFYKLTFYFIARFLAMAKLKQTWLCSSGLTKTFHFMARFL